MFLQSLRLKVAILGCMRCGVKAFKSEGSWTWSLGLRLRGSRFRRGWHSHVLAAPQHSVAATMSIGTSEMLATLR